MRCEVSDYLLPLSRLREADACAEQYAICAREWPDGIPLTDETAARIVVLRLDVEWAPRSLLSPPSRAAYQAAVAPSRAAYEAAEAPSWDAYQAAVATALIAALRSEVRGV